MPALPRPPATLTRGLALASVVANAGIVVTGGAVRLTGSGLGCPTWPRCTDSSYVPTRALSYHSAIEFSNRMMAFVVGLVAVAMLVATLLQRPRRRRLVHLSVAAALGIPAQAILGGVTVLTGLNPWVVAAHLLLSMVLIAVTVALWRRTRFTADGLDDVPRRVVRPEMLLLTRVLVGVTAVTLAMGTVVTASGPHAGDPEAGRTGLDPAMVSQLHADVVMLLVGLTFATWVALRATGSPPATRRAAAVLVATELAQGLVGYTQYFTDLPIALVGIHMLGACLVWIAALRLLFATRTRDGEHPAPATADADADAEVDTTADTVAVGAAERPSGDTETTRLAV